MKSLARGRHRSLRAHDINEIVDIGVYNYRCIDQTTTPPNCNGCRSTRTPRRSTSPAFTTTDGTTYTRAHRLGDRCRPATTCTRRRPTPARTHSSTRVICELKAGERVEHRADAELQRGSSQPLPRRPHARARTSSSAKFPTTTTDPSASSSRSLRAARRRSLRRESRASSAPASLPRRSATTACARSARSCERSFSRLSRSVSGNAIVLELLARAAAHRAPSSNATRWIVSQRLRVGGAALGRLLDELDGGQRRDRRLEAIGARALDHARRAGLEEAVAAEELGDRRAAQVELLAAVRVEVGEAPLLPRRARPGPWSAPRRARATCA